MQSLKKIHAWAQMQEPLSLLISTKWDKARIKLWTAGSVNQTRYQLQYVARSRVLDNTIRMNDFISHRTT